MTTKSRGYIKRISKILIETWRVNHVNHIDFYIVWSDENFLTQNKWFVKKKKLKINDGNIFIFLGVNSGKTQTHLI
jgi:ABC-type multidrug transport system ATPase subunit